MGPGGRGGGAVTKGMCRGGKLIPYTRIYRRRDEGSGEGGNAVGQAYRDDIDCVHKILMHDYISGTRISQDA